METASERFCHRQLMVFLRVKALRRVGSGWWGTGGQRVQMTGDKEKIMSRDLGNRQGKHSSPSDEVALELKKNASREPPRPLKQRQR